MVIQNVQRLYTEMDQEGLLAYLGELDSNKREAIHREFCDIFGQLSFSLEEIVQKCWYDGNLMSVFLDAIAVVTEKVIIRIR